MRGFLTGLILGGAAALGGLYYYGSFQIADIEMGRERGAGDDVVEVVAMAEEDAGEAVDTEEEAAEEDAPVTAHCPSASDVAAGSHAGWTLAAAYDAEERATAVKFYKAHLAISKKRSDDDEVQCEYETNGEAGNSFVHIVSDGRNIGAASLDGPWVVFYETRNRKAWNCGPEDGLANTDCDWDET